MGNITNAVKKGTVKSWFHYAHAASLSSNASVKWPSKTRIIRCWCRCSLYCVHCLLCLLNAQEIFTASIQRDDVCDTIDDGCSSQQQLWLRRAEYVGPPY